MSKNRENRTLPVGIIKPSAMNPRKSMDQDALAELTESIRQQGLLQPILVRPSEFDEDVDEGEIVSVVTGYEIVCGERRWRACGMAGLTEVPCVVADMTDAEAFDAMVTENLQRQDVDPVEEGEAFKLLMQRGATTRELGQRFGKSDDYIRGRIGLTNLTDGLKKALSEGRLTIGGARILSRLDGDEMAAFEADYSDGTITTSDVEEYCNDLWMVLWNAPFTKEGTVLDHEWNADGTRYSRHCEKCPGNTACQGTLFPGFSDIQPRCTNRVCYNQKCRAYYEWLLTVKWDGRMTKTGEKPSAGQIVALASQYTNNPDGQKLVEKWLDGIGVGVFKTADVGSMVYNRELAEKMIAEGEPVCRAIDIDAFVSFRRPNFRYFYLKQEKKAGPTEQTADAPALSAEARRLKAELSEMNESLKNNLRSERLRLLRESRYTARTGAKEEWEKRVAEVALIERVPFSERAALIPDYFPKYGQVCDLSTTDKAVLERKAIAAILADERHADWLKEAVDWLAGDEMRRIANELQKRHDDRRRKIADRLMELGIETLEK